MSKSSPEKISLGNLFPNNRKKVIPDELVQHILPFNWDVKSLWTLDTTPMLVSRREFDYLLELRLWSSAPGRGMLFDLSPITVIRSPLRFQHQQERIQGCDLKHPLDFLEHAGQFWILDGIHRLAKHYMQATEKIAIRAHTIDTIPKILV